MAEHRVVLDAFAEARRTWDDMVTLQPDVLAGSGQLQENDLVEFQSRVDAHREAIDALAARSRPSLPARPDPASREPTTTCRDRGRATA